MTHPYQFSPPETYAPPEAPSAGCAAMPGSASPSDKPPLGVMPQNAWEWMRCKDLARAIHEYFESGHRPNEQWITELAKRYPHAR